VGRLEVGSPAVAGREGIRAALNLELPRDAQGAKRAAGPGAPPLLSAELAAQPSVLLLTTAAPGPSCSASTWGQLLVIGWSVTLCVIIVRTRVLPRWLGVTGLAVSALYLLNQGDILATAVPPLPGLGPGRPDRQHRLGPLGGGPRRHHPPAPRPPRPSGAPHPQSSRPRPSPGAEQRISTRPPPEPHAAHTGPPLTDARTEYQPNTNGGTP